ncbi:peptidoglycan-binding protein LysM [Paracoccus pacificus]|uniref:Peptidoglycan-binding protein LysM n=1 Tax=Paracoccus pacificus TaxID=1463598 RepID=A0ABW4R8V6_9RHOB
MAFWDFVKDAGKSVFGGEAKAAEPPAPKAAAPKPAAAPAAAKPAATAPAAAPAAAPTAQKSEIEQRADALRKEVARLGLDGNDVQLTLRGDEVIIKGNVKDQATREKLILAVGNVKGVARVVADDFEGGAEPVFYTVKKGDTLSEIAQKTLGSASRYKEIFEANKPMLTDPDKIYPGQSLRIPQ